MTCLLACTRSGICQADQACRRPSRFQARLDAGHGTQGRLCKDAEACASHLADIVQALTTWARENNFREGNVIVLAIEPPPYNAPTEDLSKPHQSRTPGFVFSTIRLSG
ncbi:MAG TPA: hypothetical protein DHU96_19420 [Actinobacteria bacterium]|nr:hypothetical protein [Actinomycetota bacterium]